MATSSTWEGHYTGIETRQIGPHRLNVYLQRDRKSKLLQFARITVRRRSFGFHLGRQNYARNHVTGGIQFFTNGLHFGFGRPSALSSRKLVHVNYSGSMREPYSAFSVVLFGRIVFGGDSPAWLVRRKEEQLRKQWEGWGDDYPFCDDGTMTNPEQEV